MLDIEINPQFRKALDCLEQSNDHLFITGRAGTGKSTLLQLYRQTVPENTVVLAPTGVAALNVLGETIHSFFRFRPDINLEAAEKAGLRAGKSFAEKFNSLDAIIIDEVSMLRADMLDCIDLFLRRARRQDEPFGGTRIILFGDLYQLPPVVKGADAAYFREVYSSPYFFDAQVMLTPGLPFQIVELIKIYRQSQQEFIDLLNAIRDKSITESELGRLNERVLPPDSFDSDGYIHLTGTNRIADNINDSKLEALPGSPRIFQAEVDGEFKPHLYPTAKEIILKSGAQVMFLNNDASHRWVNGTLGVVMGFGTGEDEGSVRVSVEGRKEELVWPNSWNVYETNYNKDVGKLEQESVGSFTQLPLRLAWAVTIHKGQGKTFEKVVVDLGGRAFAHGQTYVALSRCRTFEGLVLSRELKTSDLLTDYRVHKFLTQFQYDESEQACSFERKIELIEQCLDNGWNLDITYLKPNNQKSRRTIRPVSLGIMSYKGKEFWGMNAFCLLRKAKRNFKVDRILSLEVDRN